MIESKAFRQALSHFATGVTVVTTRDAAGEPVGVTASSFNTVSLDPPLVLWSIGRHAFSFPAAEHFAVHVLGEHQQEWSNRFGRAGEDKFSGLACCEGIAELPLLDGCPVRFECVIEHRYEGGDHLILVGRVLRVTEAGNAAAPLLFHRGRYAGLETTPGV
jgi:flavin reductase (DIM6/NTAB) family NADH-FMN oxidoreductase RutF